MANSGTKFASVNLNKSYGQHGQHQSSHYTHFSGGSGSYGQAAAAGRGRPGSGGSGGMVVLSRNRGPQKVAPKLSIPPPLNLPSLRKEHEKFDISGPVAGGAGQGAGQRAAASAVGWTKPIVAKASPEKNDNARIGDGVEAANGVSRGVSSYMPPSARPDAVTVPGHGSGPQEFPPLAEKSTVLRGEDFPSLQAARPVSSGATQKQKDGVNQKQKQIGAEDMAPDKRGIYDSSSLVDMNSQGQFSRNSVKNRSWENGGEGHVMSNSRISDENRKQEDYFPGPLPLVRLNPRSDWADDERDTSHGFAERGKDVGYSKSEIYWDRDFDLPKPSFLPHKPVYNQQDRLGQRDNEAGKFNSSEVLKADPYPKDLRTPSREGREVNKWRTSAFPVNSDDVGNERSNVGARTTGPNNTWKDNKYTLPRFGDTGRDGNITLNQDSTFGRRDTGQYVEERQHWNNLTESYNNRGTLRNSRDCYGSEQSNRYRSDNSYNNTSLKSSFVSSGKMPLTTDTVLASGREKHTFSKGDGPFLEDPSAGFDGGDIFSVGLIKRKKDVSKSTDFYDPVRESFEAELERVQQMQELERQRIIEEQERAMEQARREEEERQRRIREEEERQRRIEEEAREAAWRAEQERLEAIQRAEEQRIAREEEKRRMALEEERRKQAAKQKLLELEARIAKRQTEGSKEGASLPNSVADEKLEAVKDVSRSNDLENWEDGERMVEKVTTSAPCNASTSNRHFEMSAGPYPAREGSSSFIDRGRFTNNWRRDAVQNGGSFFSSPQDQEAGHQSPRRDAFGGGRAVPRKEFYGAAGYISSRAYPRMEPYSDDFAFPKDQRWNLPRDVDSYGRSRETDSEFRNSPEDNYDDIGWGQGPPRGSAHAPYPEQLYPNSEADELYSYGRSRYSMRQPRVLPPPSVASGQGTSFRGINENSGPSTFPHNDIHYNGAARSESTRQISYYGSNQESLEPTEVPVTRQDNTSHDDQHSGKDVTSRLDSQSSLSVSSPPISPPHLSHDELDGSGDSPVISAVLNNASGDSAAEMARIPVGEDEEWTLENDDEFQQPEEYDEDENGYREDDEVREGDDDNVGLKFEDLHLEESESGHMMDNVVLGFDEGVEVVIPCDDFEKNMGTGEEQGCGGERSIETAGGPGVSPDSSSENVQQMERTSPGSIAQQTSVLSAYTAATSTFLGSNDLCGSGISAQKAITSSGDAIPTIGQTNTAGRSADVPINLQFGLFTGPPLIPSPVPAIQIGSIQMPLHIHPSGCPSVAHVHSSQSPIFQFGQLGYSSPISQGILPMVPQSLSLIQPNVQAHYSLNQNGGSAHCQPGHDAARQNMATDEVPSLPNHEQTGFVSGSRKHSNRDLPTGVSSVPDKEISGDSSLEQANKVSGTHDDKINGSQLGERRQHDEVSKVPSLKDKGSQSIDVEPSMQYVSHERSFGGSRGQGPLSSRRGKRYAYAVKNPNMRSPFSAPNAVVDSNSFQRGPRRTLQRTEFRIRESNEKKQANNHVSSNTAGLSYNTSYNVRAVGVTSRSGSKRGSFSNRNTKQRVESESMAGNVVHQEINSADRIGKETAKDGSINNQSISHPAELNLKRNVFEEDVDAPLQSGVVRVFKQSGIEAPSDDDDFIEVRSKRQMLNDRREQREKEIKAKSRISKPPRRHRANRQITPVSSSPNKLPASLHSEASGHSQSNLVALEGRHLAKDSEVSSGFITSGSQPLAPIGTPSGNSEAQAVRSHKKSSVYVPDGGDVVDLVFKSNDNNVQSSLSTWGPSGIDQQVMALTQSQLEEAMKPAKYDSQISDAGNRSSMVSDPILPSPSTFTKDKSSSGITPVNSLLAGERILFGAVTSPTVLPPSSRVVSHVIGAPGSNRPDIQTSSNIRSADDTSLFLEKDKQPSASDSTLPLQDSEAEAEAAASAIAVAAISSDENVVNGLGDSKSFVCDATVGIPAGLADQKLSSQSRGEELSVSLPADLSVETTPISLWPPLPSPQSSSSQMLSNFPGAPPSHFPFYEVNPMLGGPIFAFGPQEESSGTQLQSQKSSSSGSGPLGTWQHPGVDSFYGPPAGFTGSFIGPPGGIPAVQGPPHMVVYNHFAPVGQYGPVGLSFMGATYIPSAKQPDWKHNPSSAAMHVGEGDVSNHNMPNAQRNSQNMPTSVQHLAPGSPLLPIASPLPMFDVASFQSAPDLSVQARWSHVPAPPLHSVSLSQPLQQQQGILPSHVGHGHAIEQLNANRFSESQKPSPSEDGPSSTVAADKKVTQFPTELGLLESARSIAPVTSGQSCVVGSSGSTNGEPVKIDLPDNSIGNNGKRQSSSSAKAQLFQQKSEITQQNSSTGYYHQRGGTSHRNSAGNDWANRRMGFHGRNQYAGADKGFPGSKVKQIYVAKQTPSGTSTAT